MIRRGVGGALGILGGVGQPGEGEQVGSVYKQPEREVDDSCHNWREPSKWSEIQRGYKGETRGSQRGAKGEQGEICKRDVCVRVIEPLE